MSRFDTVIRVDGINETIAALDRLGAAGEREIFKAVRGSLESVRSTALKKIMREPKTGRIYERGPGQNLSPTHQASAPGEAPASDSGILAGSVKVVQPSRSFGYVGTDRQYGFWLEYGTTRMQARPWLRPSLEENRERILGRFAAALARATEAYR